MRAVRRAADLPAAFERCRSEAERAFGNGAVYLEQLLTGAKHVEVQIVGDGSGAISQVGYRECSVQRRHQKPVEMAPCSTLLMKRRKPLLDAARLLARAVDYQGLGTFRGPCRRNRLVVPRGQPRVQVEHTVSEQVGGIDLVAASLEIARGRTLDELGLAQHRVPAPGGIAMQVRVNLERLDVSGTTHPTIGTVATFEVPAGPGVRVDTHGHAGYVATARYDPLLAKVVVHTPRAGLEAVAEATEAALAEFRIDGPATKHRAVARHHGAPVVPGWVVHHGVRRRAPFRTAARRAGRRTGGGGHGGRAIRGHGRRAPRSPLPAPRWRTAPNWWSSK